MAVAGGQRQDGAGGHAEGEGQHAGRAGQDGEGRFHLPQHQVADPDSGLPLRRSPVLWSQRCMSSPPIPPTSTHPGSSVARVNTVFSSFVQLYFYAFDIFSESGVPKDQTQHLALGIGATELTAVTLCVSSP